MWWRDRCRPETIALDRSTTTLRRVGDVVEARLGDGTSAQFPGRRQDERGLGLGTTAQSAAQDVSPPDAAPVRPLKASHRVMRPRGERVPRELPAMTTTDSSGFAASARAEATMAAWVNLPGLLVIKAGYLIIAVVNSLVVATHVRRREIALLRLVGGGHSSYAPCAGRFS